MKKRISIVTGHLSALAGMLMLAIVLNVAAEDWTPEKTADGWTDLSQFLVKSDGTRDTGQDRDRGSMIVFFDPEAGDNATGEIYWWDGEKVLDGSGSANNGDGLEYGTDPLEPNEEAIRAFAHRVNDSRLEGTTGYADWFLFRRGRVHETFDTVLHGGRSQSEPMVVSAYGPLREGRAIIKPKARSPFVFNTRGGDIVHFHQVLHGLEIYNTIHYLGAHRNVSSPGEPGVPTWLIEDCKLVRAQMNYMPIGTTVRRSISAWNWNAKGHNQGYWNSEYHVRPTFEEVIFYRNGFKEDPRTHADPRRTMFDRNIYQGGGAQMGHTYRNIISAAGGSGSPQMRYGGLIENSLIVEGYWYSSTHGTITAERGPNNAWLVDGKQQRGRTAVVRNNVQLIYKYPSPADPDTPGKSQGHAQPGNGYMLGGASFGALIENNIISGALMADDLGFGKFGGRSGFRMGLDLQEYQDGKTYTQQRNTFRGNIAYRTNAGFWLDGNGTDASGHVLENNVFAAKQGVSASNVEGLESTDQLVFRNNRVYAEEKVLPEAPWMGSGNTVMDYSAAAEKEGWPDPDRTLKRYVTEELGLTLLDWSDDPWLPEEEVAPRVKTGEAYDPMGLKTFMAVATNMRRGGADEIPAEGKPDWTGDYPWDARFTGVAVVNWVRDGFGLDPVGETTEQEDASR